MVSLALLAGAAKMNKDIWSATNHTTCDHDFYISRINEFLADAVKGASALELPETQMKEVSDTVALIRDTWVAGGHSDWTFKVERLLSLLTEKGVYDDYHVIGLTNELAKLDRPFYEGEVYSTAFLELLDDAIAAILKGSKQVQISRAIAIIAYAYLARSFFRHSPVTKRVRASASAKETHTGGVLIEDLYKSDTFALRPMDAVLPDGLAGIPDIDGASCVTDGYASASIDLRSFAAVHLLGTGYAPLVWTSASSFFYLTDVTLPGVYSFQAAQRYESKWREDALLYADFVFVVTTAADPLVVAAADDSVLPRELTQYAYPSAGYHITRYLAEAVPSSFKSVILERGEVLLSYELAAKEDLTTLNEEGTLTTTKKDTELGLGVNRFFGITTVLEKVENASDYLKVALKRVSALNRGAKAQLSIALSTKLITPLMQKVDAVVTGVTSQVSRSWTFLTATVPAKVMTSADAALEKATGGLRSVLDIEQLPEDPSTRGLETGAGVIELSAPPFADGQPGRSVIIDGRASNEDLLLALNFVTPPTSARLRSGMPGTPDIKVLKQTEGASRVQQTLKLMMREISNADAKNGGVPWESTRLRVKVQIEAYRAIEAAVARIIASAATGFKDGGLTVEAQALVDYHALYAGKNTGVAAVVANPVHLIKAASNESIQLLSRLANRLVTSVFVLETGRGKAMSKAPDGRISFNVGNIKIPSVQAADWVEKLGSHGFSLSSLNALEFDDKGQQYREASTFAVYPNLECGVLHFLLFTTLNDRYREVWRAKSEKEVLNRFAMSGYATDPLYGAKLDSVATYLTTIDTTTA